MRYRGLAVAALLLAGGCQGGKDDSTASAAPGIEAAPTADDASAAPSEAPPEHAGRKVEATNDLYEFSFSYPDAAGAIPGVRDLLDARLVKARSELAATAREDRDTAAKEDYPFHPHGFDATWATVADLPDWLSLSADVYTFSNGAHGMNYFDALLWDKRAGTARRARDLFTSAEALRDAIRDPFCDALDAEREKRRGEPVDRDGEQMFSECIDPLAQTLLLGSSNGRTFDRIGILVAPYEAGPYAEGSYEVTLPVTGEVMAVLKPQYRSSFSLGK